MVNKVQPDQNMVLPKLLFIGTAVPALVFGLFMYYRPQKAIAVQQKFYSCINWRMEPISWDREVRSTKWMGLFLIGVVIAAVIYYCLNAQ